ncbi:hypothetical protein [Candidatus Hadarchaeum sp.]|uniref:hypothetical protein n=1 Tax=Candidatus Hadarchaeum sp. TaxID=2883567 RepID=UPI00319DDC08
MALWREALLAQEVLRIRTRSWKNRLKLDRSKAHPDPVSAIGSYLHPLREKQELSFGT